MMELCLIFAENIQVKAVDYEDGGGEVRFIMGSVVSESPYKITYHPNGGSGTMPPSLLSAGERLAPNTFSRTGYTFTGWSVQTEGDAFFSDRAMIFPSSDMDLYAVWKVNQYPVFLENTGEGGSVSFESIPYGSPVLIKAGIKKGYRFDGWSVESGGVLLTNISDAETTFSMPDEEVRFRANWVLDSYSITVSGGGQGSSYPETSLYQSTVTIQAGTREGYTFLGWEVEAGGVTLADASNSVTTFVMGSSEVKLRILWQVKRYTVTVTNKDGGSTEQQEIDYGETARVHAGEKAGYYFCGWEVAEGNISLENAEKEEITFSMPASNVVLRAVWKEITGVEAVCSDNFYNKYNHPSYYKNGSYNINKNITITKEMLDVRIRFADGDSILAKSRDYEISNAAIRLLGENKISIHLTTGNAGLISVISLIGYSPELDAVMQELGIAEGNYSELAAKVEQMQTRIHDLNTEIAKYEQNLTAIKETLAKTGTEPDLTGDLKEQLENTEYCVKEATDRLIRAEEEFNKIKYVTADMIQSLGAEQELFQEYKNLSDILKILQEEIEKTKEHEAAIREEMQQIADRLEIKENISNAENIKNGIFFEKIKEKIDDIKNQLDLYKSAIVQLKNNFQIVNDASLEVQLEQTIKEIQKKLSYLNGLTDEIERQLNNPYSEIDTDGMKQVEAIFAKIYGLKTYANHLTQFYDSLKDVLGFGSGSTKEEVAQKISNMKDKITEYDRFLTDAKKLIGLDRETGDGSLETGEQTKEELDKVYTEMADIVEQLEFFKEVFQALLEKEEISMEQKEELKNVLEQIMKQKETIDVFINSLKNLLEIDKNGGQTEIYQKISAIKETMKEYWGYLGEVEQLMQINNPEFVVSSSAIQTGVIVTERLAKIYEKLTEMIGQQDKMSQTIEELLHKEEVSSAVIKELEEISQEVIKQKEQTDIFLKELKKLLGLEESADYKEVIYTVTDMKKQLQEYITGIEQLTRQLSIAPLDGLQGNPSEQLKTILHKVLELISQLEIQESTSSGSSETFDFENLKNLERKNQLQQERIAELEKYLQKQIKETDNILFERTKLLDQISEKDRQIEELKKQIESLTTQLTERESRVKELESTLQNQKPIQELLEKNQIDYKQLVQLLSSKEKNEKIPILPEEKEVKATESRKQKEEKTEEKIKTTESPDQTEKRIENTNNPDQTEEGIILEKEKREDWKTAITAEAEEMTSLEEMEETAAGTESESEDISKGTKLSWGVIILILVVLIVIGAGIVVLCGRNNLK